MYVHSLAAFAAVNEYLSLGKSDYIKIQKNSVGMVHVTLALFLIFLKGYADAGHVSLKSTVLVPGAPFSFSPAIDTGSAISIEAKTGSEASVAQTLSKLQYVRQHNAEEPGSERESALDYTNKEQQNQAALQSSIEGIAKGSTTKLTEDTGSDELPQGPSPAKEKESKEREKGGFMSDKSSSASEAFSNSNIEAGGIGADQSIRDDKKKMIEAIASNAEPEKMTKKDMEEMFEIEQGPRDFPPEPLRDYSHQCPEEFYPLSTECHARDSYKGPCARIQKDLYKLSHTAKAVWAQSCGADWPPLPNVCEKGTNYNYACPVGWINLGKGICQNTNRYASVNCSRKVQFGLMSKTEKMQFEGLCGLRWPCRAPVCEKNYNAICPHEWKHLGGFVCEAPATYTGPCDKKADMQEKVDDWESKVNFEKSCSTNWPCYPYSCDRDFEALCPLGWLQLEDSTCKAPFTFTSSKKCPSLINFSNLEPDARESFSVVCQIDFPCKDRTNCRKDFYSRCPVDWKDLGDGKNCQAPLGYSGNCDKMMNFADMSEKEKESKMLECSLQWPCIGEWRYSPANINL